MLEAAVEKAETQKLLNVATASRQNSKKFWQYVRSSVDRKPLPPISDDNRLLHFGDNERANILNNAFTAVMLPCGEHCAQSEDFCHALPSEQSWPPFTEAEVSSALYSMDPNKSNRPFKVTIGLLQRTGGTSVSALTKLFNLCCSFGYFPDAWKTAYVFPIPKATKDPTNASAWRPISILHPVSKCFEKCLANRLRLFLESVDAFGESQFGFREGRSTEMAGLLISRTWTDILDSKIEIDAVFLDCTKAFDRVNHDILLKKLEHLQVPKQCLAVLNSYLLNRRQVVVVNGKYSNPVAVTSGVPQGSVLGPIMFIAMMYDINSVVSVGTSLSLFTDDILVYRPQVMDTDATSFQEDLTRLTIWGDLNQLTFNGSKSAHLRLSRKRPAGTVEYHLGGTPIPNVPHVKYLGLHIDQKLTWAVHWSVKSANGKKRVRYLNALFKYKNSAARIKLYETLVQPLADYCTSVTWSFLIGTVRDIERCGRRFLRTVRLGVDCAWSEDTRYMKNAVEVGWTSQLVRRVKLSLKYVYKLMSSTVSFGVHLFQPLEIPPQSGPATSTRGTNRMRNHPCPIQPTGTIVAGLELPTSPNSFVFIMCALWNGLDLPADAFGSKWKFSVALDSVEWKSVSLLKSLFPPELLF